MFSLALFLGAEILSTQGYCAGSLCDIVMIDKSGTASYYIVKSPLSDTLFAIPHSYFFFNEEDRTLIFDANRGTFSPDALPDLPEAYDDHLVSNCTDYIQSVLPALQPAHHRTDDE